MKGDTKRKWRWSSKGLIASSQPNKVLIVDQSMLDTHDGTADRFAINEMSLDGCSMEDGYEHSGMAARMRRHGSRLLSIVGLQRSSGLCSSLVELLKHPLNRGQTSGIPSVPQILQVSEMLLWLSSRMPQSPRPRRRLVAKPLVPWVYWSRLLARKRLLLCCTTTHRPGSFPRLKLTERKRVLLMNPRRTSRLSLIWSLLIPTSSVKSQGSGKASRIQALLTSSLIRCLQLLETLQ